MPRPPTINDQKMIQYARDYFLTHGHTASVKQLGEQIGLSHAAIFQRFKSKKLLMIEALRPPTELPWRHIIEKGPQKNKNVLGHPFALYFH